MAFAVLRRMAHPVRQAQAAKRTTVLLNAAAGLGHDEFRAEAVRDTLAGLGVDVEVALRRPGERLRELAQRALQARPAVLVAAGGDGTVSTVADVVRGSGTALGILPVGTLNHFARDLGIPLDVGEAAQVLARGRRIAVDVGEVNGRCFINNASLGIYPNIVRERKRQQQRLGRSKRHAMLWATLAVLDRNPFLELRLQLEDRMHDCRAPFVFVGNNDFTMEGFDIGTRARLDRGLLDVYTTRRCTPRGMLLLALRALFGRLRQADDFIESKVVSLRVESRRPRLLVATDGEIAELDTPLEFRVLPRALEVLVP
jgi:diacylglycerol kinase family enzyme